MRQTGTLKDYIIEFHRLANRARDVGPVLLKSCFLGGLKRELIYDVKLLRPAIVHDAISIVVQVDSKLFELRVFNPRILPSAKITPLPILPPKPKTPMLPFRKLTLEKVQRKNDKGECWFCPRKGHKCGHKQLLLLDVNEEGDLCEDLDEEVSAEIQGMALSAFYGVQCTRSLQTMKVLGTVNNHTMHILLDFGSTHNFIDSRLLKTLGYSLQATKPFEVMIADGGKITS